MVTNLFHWLFLLAILSLLGCQQNYTNKKTNSYDSDVTVKEDSLKFFQYYSKLKNINPPLTLSCGLPSDVSYDYAPFNNYFSRNFDSPLYVAGKIYQSRVFVTLLYGIVGDDLYPVLFNYNNNGIKIDSLDLSGICDGDEGYISSTTVTLNKDYSIFKVDSLTRYFENELDKMIKGTDSTTIISYKFIIQSNGHFTLEDSTKKIISTK